MAVQPGFVLDLVGNPEDRFSHNEAQVSFVHSYSESFRVPVIYLTLVKIRVTSDIAYFALFTHI